MGLPRRRIDELLARYELEPSLRDLYVEGRFDRDLLQWFLSEAKIESAVVYEIDSVEIPSEFIGDEFPVGNRSRLIALSQVLAAQDVHGNVICVVDRDLDQAITVIGGQTRSAGCTTLLYTDYSSMEAYLFDPFIIGKFLRLVAGQHEITPDDVLSCLQPVVLRSLFSVRVASAYLDLKLKLVPPVRCCSLSPSGASIDFDMDEYLVRVVNKTGRRGVEEEKIRFAIEEVDSLDLGDHRSCLHGHDFLQLLYWYCRSKRIGASLREEHVKRYLLACVESTFLEQFPLFSEILRRMR